MTEKQLPISIVFKEVHQYQHNAELLYDPEIPGLPALNFIIDCWKFPSYDDIKWINQNLHISAFEPQEPYDKEMYVGGYQLVYYHPDRINATQLSIIQRRQFKGHTYRSFGNEPIGFQNYPRNPDIMAIISARGEKVGGRR
jgi:hypothetical protein